MFSIEVDKMHKDENEKYSFRWLQAPTFSSADQFQAEFFNVVICPRCNWTQQPECRKGTWKLAEHRSQEVCRKRNLEVPREMPEGIKPNFKHSWNGAHVYVIQLSQTLGFPGGSVSKESACSAGDSG